MQRKKTKYIETDVLVIGSGIAGLYFALNMAKKSKVVIATKKELMESNSNYAQGGIAAVLDPLDNYTAHIKDTMNAGGNINSKKAVEILVKEAPKHIHNLIDLGVGFNRNEGKLDLTREGGHSNRRIVHVNDATGREVERALIFNTRNHKNIKAYESIIALDLITNKKGEKVCGATLFDHVNNQYIVCHAKFVVLATGGCGQVYQHTTNPKIATGDGVAMAQRAGADLKGMEFIQFHPTTLNLPGKPHFLLSESLRGEGAVLRDAKKKRFMSKYSASKELASRDIVSRAVFTELQKGPVYLDISHKPSKYIKNRFPYIYEQLWWYNLKLDKDLIPISPAAHYLCGGVNTDLHGRSSINGLYVIGESAHTGVHGGNRLASNSILECLVFASRASSSIATALPKTRFIKGQVPTLNKIITTPKRVHYLKKRVKDIMWDNVGIVRDSKILTATHKKLSTINNELQLIQLKGTNVNIQETINITQVAMAITAAAIKRKDSVGAHYVKD
ncbi:MAG: L-aspartate oxidase [bacterium]|nr:L-aspartate oxidase [bacterium]